MQSSKRFGKLEYSDEHNAPGICIAPNGNYVAIWAHLYDKHKVNIVLYEIAYIKYKNNKPSSIPTGDVDTNSSGLLPLYLFTFTNDSSLLKLGKAATDNSLQHKGYPRTAIDDVYMTGSLDYLNASKGCPGDSHGTAVFLRASAAVYQYFPDALTTGVIKNCPDHVLTAKRSPITKYHYFNLKGRCISINNGPKNLPEANTGNNNHERFEQVQTMYNHNKVT